MVLVAFSVHKVATILLVGPHDDRDPFMDVYAQLYELAGLTEPSSAEPDSCRELLDGAHAKLRAKVAAARRRDNGSERRKQSGTRHVCYS
jgi:hypothetical protein